MKRWVKERDIEKGGGGGAWETRGNLEQMFNPESTKQGSGSFQKVITNYYSR